MSMARCSKSIDQLVGKRVEIYARDAHISVCASLQHGEVLVQVIDDGPGIPEGSERQLFEKFYRGQSEGQSPARGSDFRFAAPLSRRTADAYGREPAHRWGDLLDRPASPGGSDEHSADPT